MTARLLAVGCASILQTRDAMRCLPGARLQFFEYETNGPRDKNNTERINVGHRRKFLKTGVAPHTRPRKHTLASTHDSRGKKAPSPKSAAIRGGVSKTLHT